MLASRRAAPFTLAIVLSSLGLAASACDQSNAQTPADQPVTTHKWKTAGYRETDPASRVTADQQLAALDLGLPSDWMADRQRDGKRQFARDGVVLEVYLAEAQELVAVADEPVASLDDLVGMTRSTALKDGWPFWSYRYKALTDKGSAGGDFWVRGTLQKNEQCNDGGCPDAWQDSGEAGFVVFRILGSQRVRCAAHGLDLGGGNAALDAAFTACRSMTLTAK